MKLIIHDLKEEIAKELFAHHSEEYKIISASREIAGCTGCFGCWVKTPAECVIPDKYHHIGAILANSEELILISNCIYGCYSPEVKGILDRSISYLLPFFTTRNKMVHHKTRYKNKLNFTAYFYGEEINPKEVFTAQKLVAANACNFNTANYNTFFLKNPLELRGAFQ